MCSCGMDIFASEYRRILQFLITVMEFRVHKGEEFRYKDYKTKFELLRELKGHIAWKHNLDIAYIFKRYDNLIRHILRAQPTRRNVSHINLFLQGALHVSDDFSVHHQEHKTAHTASGLTLYVQFWFPDDGRKTSLKHVERLTEINKFQRRCISLLVIWEYISDTRTNES